jgi:hypothetical protein
MTWLATANGYEVTLRSGQIVCRNAAGKELKSVPSKVKLDPVAIGLEQLVQWLDRHEAQCRADIDRWMIRSLPIPMAVLVEVWPDDSWRTALTDLVVAVLDEKGAWDPDEVGLLRDVDEKGIGMVNLDGETVRVTAERVVLPHPVLLSDLDDLREFINDLNVKQPLDQLFREIWQRPTEFAPAVTSVKDYAGGKYKALSHLTARASSNGYPVRGGYAVCRVFEGGRTVEARVWVGSDDPSYETETGDLVFTDRDGNAIPLPAVGPITWSEGMRMAAVLYAGRVVEEQEEQAA